MSMSTRRPKDIARSAASAFANRKRGGDAFRRETFALPREAAREGSRTVSPLSQDGLYDRDRSWRVLPGDRIEFTVRRLPSAD